MKYSTIACTLLIVFAGLRDGRADSGIQLANSTAQPISVYLQGAKDAKYRPPVHIPARSTVVIMVPDGRYYVATRLSSGRWHYIGWRYYSGNRITYDVTLTAICAPPGANLARQQTPVAGISQVLPPTRR